MKLNKPKNNNYCATIVEIAATVKLPNCDNVQHAIVLGNHVVVDNSVKKGDMGIYFPIETQLSKEYLSANNLYRKSELNLDTTQKGYFEENGRVKCVKFRGNKSEGFFMPLESLVFTISDLTDALTSIEWKPGIEFDEINGIEICRKYVPKYVKTPGSGTGKSKDKKLRESKIIDGQFRFHQDTNMLYKNLHQIYPETLISITYKMHGTSGISSKILCKKPLKIVEKAAKFVGLNIVDIQYDFINASRKVIKNSDLNPKGKHYYNEDIWGLADQIIRPFLQDGMIIYYEIVGFLKSGGYIQKDYDYGQLSGTFGIYIYRITYTNSSGKVFEFSAKQIQDWCRNNDLKAVPELFYGRASEIFSDNRLSIDTWRDRLLEKLKELYTEKQCFMCRNDVPEEGFVLRIEGLDFEAYKCKSEAFYLRETKLLDKGEFDIEEQQNEAA